MEFHDDGAALDDDARGGAGALEGVGEHVEAAGVLGVDDGLVRVQVDQALAERESRIPQLGDVGRADGKATDAPERSEVDAWNGE